MRGILKQARKEKGLKQVEIAQLLQITDRHYQHIEAGTRGTSESNWLKLYDLFGKKIPLHELMEQETKDLFPLPTEASPKEKTIISK